MEKRAQILVIDDKADDCLVLQALLQDLPYDMHFSPSGVDGIVKASTIHPDVILLEINLPYLDGFEVCKLIRSHYALGEIPVVLMSWQDSPAARLDGLKAGSDDFISKPINQMELLGRLQGVIRLNRYRLILEQRRKTDDEIKDDVGATDQNILGWSHLLEMRDKETEGHVKRVSDMSLALARAAGLNEDAMKQIWRGAMLHDLGMMGIPDSILKKPGALDMEDWKIIHEHPLSAYKWFSSVDYLRPALDIPYCHHEKWDGSGYPRGLKGTQIPFSARLFAVVDVWDALTSDRPFRRAVPAAEARQYIEEQAGRHFDPQVVELFGQLLDKA
ncbi:MAG: HD domain-containing phosphohydrolase [Chloroflexota bacterium]